MKAHTGCARLDSSPGFICRFTRERRIVAFAAAPEHRANPVGPATAEAARDCPDFDFNRRCAFSCASVGRDLQVHGKEVDPQVPEFSLRIRHARVGSGRLCARDRFPHDRRHSRGPHCDADQAGPQRRASRRRRVSAPRRHDNRRGESPLGRTRRNEQGGIRQRHLRDVDVRRFASGSIRPQGSGNEHQTVVVGRRHRREGEPAVNPKEEQCIRT